MAVKITQKIIGFDIVKTDAKLAMVAEDNKDQSHQQMSEAIKRPEVLVGAT